MGTNYAQIMTLANMNVTDKSIMTEVHQTVLLGTQIASKACDTATEQIRHQQSQIRLRNMMDGSNGVIEKRKMFVWFQHCHTTSSSIWLTGRPAYTHLK